MFAQNLKKVEVAACWLVGLHPRDEPERGLSVEQNSQIKAVVELAYDSVAGGEPGPRALLATRVGKILEGAGQPFMAKQVYLPFVGPLIERGESLEKLRERLRLTYHSCFVVPLTHYLEEWGWLGLIVATGKRHEVGAAPKDVAVPVAVYLGYRWASQGLDQVSQELRERAATWITEQSYPALEERFRQIFSSIVLGPLGWEVLTPLVAGGPRQTRRELLIRVMAVAALVRCPGRQRRVLIVLQVALVTVQIADQSFLMLREERLISINLQLVYQERLKAADGDSLPSRIYSTGYAMITWIGWRIGPTAQEEKEDELLPRNTSN